MRKLFYCLGRSLDVSPRGRSHERRITKEVVSLTINGNDSVAIGRDFLNVGNDIMTACKKYAASVR